MMARFSTRGTLCPSGRAAWVRARERAATGVDCPLRSDRGDAARGAPGPPALTRGSVTAKRIGIELAQLAVVNSREQQLRDHRATKASAMSFCVSHGSPCVPRNASAALPEPMATSHSTSS